MPSRNLREAALLIIGRKTAASWSVPAVLAGFGGLLCLLWIRESFSFALRAFVFLFPYLFLVLSQDMFHDEIDSGALENVIFVNGGFREYLLSKTLILALFGLGLSTVVFMVFAVYGFALHPGQVTAGCVAQFLVGVLVGLYYLVVGGYLSFLFRAGSNVLVVIIGQVFLGIGFILSMTARRGWVEAFLSADFPGFVRKLRFLGLALLFPNAVIIVRDPLFITGLALAGLGVFGLGCRRIRKLEIFRR